MVARKRKTVKVKVPPMSDPLKQLHAHAAGIDAHSREHFVAVPIGSTPKDFVNPDANLPAHIRIFGTNTGDLKACAAWLKVCKVETVAVESTGVYHLALVEVLESHGIAIIIVDSRQTKSAPGRPKTDVLDCQWIQRLHSYGLLRASFQPGPEIRKLRAYERQREMLVRYAAMHVQHMQKALELMNCKLMNVITDIVGLTGMLIIKAIVRGVRDTKKLAAYRHPNCKAEEAEIAAALQGTWQEEYVFELRQTLKLYEEYQRRLKDCDEQIEACLKQFEDLSKGQALAAKKSSAKRKKHSMSFDVRGWLLKLLGVDATLLEGIDEATAFVLASELGPDLSAFATERHFASWLGLSPNHRGSGGRVRRRSVKASATRAARAFRMAGAGCHHAKNALGAFYRRIASRSGGAKAVVATARKIAERFYRLVTKKGDYVRQAEDHYEEAYRLKLTKSLQKRAEELGYELTPIKTPADLEPTASPTATLT
jgi:transposase